MNVAVQLQIPALRLNRPTRSRNSQTDAVTRLGPMRKWWPIILLGIGLAAGGASAFGAKPAADKSANALREQYAKLRDQLSQNAFKQPLHLDSDMTSGGLRGDIHAVVDHPFATMCQALKGTPEWCDILLLHLNVKYCRATEQNGVQRLTVYLGRKHEQSLDSAHRLDFIYEVAAEAADYRHIVLTAAKGPVGTKDYRIILEAIPLGNTQTFIHLSYSYAFGFAAKMATQAYFNTLGSDKVGFTVTGRQPDGKPIYVEDMRAALERNTMRYFLAIEAYVGALAAPPAEQIEQRLRAWFASTERYPLQLHEVTESEYLTMKRNEYKRQRDGAH